MCELVGQVVVGETMMKYRRFLRATFYSAYMYMPRQFHPSVRPFVRRVLCIKTVECIIEILSLSDRPIIQVFCHQKLLCKSDRFITNGGAEYTGDDFWPICGYISETVIDRGIFTMEDEYKVVCAPLKSAAFDDLEWPQPQF